MPPMLYLVDGHALAYRTYFALSSGGSRGFTTSKGEPTAGIFGFTSVLLRILEQERPDYIAVAFDTGKTFRDEMYPAYKGTREKMPEDLRPQIERIRQIVDAFNIPRLEMDGYEADDVLGSAARQAVEQGLGVKIITGDRDLLQLVDDRIVVNLPGRSLSDAQDYLAEDVYQKLGVYPQQVVDYKALVGDKSDNIPGVKGVGQKTASRLLATYGDLDNIYAHLSELKAGVKQKLKAGKQDAYLSQKLATIVTDLTIPLDLEQARPHRFDPAVVEELFRELEFRALRGRLKTLKKVYGLSSESQGVQLRLMDDPGSFSNADKPQDELGLETVVVDSVEALEALQRELSTARMIAFDTETTSVHKMQADITGISLAVTPDKGYYIPLGHKTGERQLPIQQVIAALRGPLVNRHIPKAGHNLKYDFVILARYGLRVAPLGFDTMIAEWLINPGSRNLGLKNLSWVRLGVKMTDIVELIGTGKQQISMAQVPVKDAAPYAAADAAMVLRLVPMLQNQLEEVHAVDLFNDVEMPLVTVLADMEMAGIGLDKDFLNDMSDELDDRLRRIETRVHELAGGPFNLNSTQQLSDVLFKRLKITPPDRTRKTTSGFYSTAASVLQSLRSDYEIVDLVLKHRELAKLKSTYVDSLPLQVNPASGRIHTSYNQTGSITGRLASSEPNLQNIPVRSDLGRKVRRAFVADQGNCLLAVDYSQVELRIVAHMAQDEAMLSAFRAGQDIHAATAAAIYHIELNGVTKSQRRRAKAINFGLIYGMSPFGLTRSTELTLAEAEEFVETYFEKFPGVKKYLDGIRAQAAQQGYVETLLGRRRYFPGLQNPGSNRNTRNREEREAINAPIQGTAADIMKIAMLRVPDAIDAAGLSARMLLQVHDELVLECPQNELEETAKVVQRVMENAYPLSIPLATDASSGLNWGELKSLTAS